MSDETLVADDDEVEGVEEAEAPEATEDSTEEEEVVEEIEFNFNGQPFRVAKDAMPEELAAKVADFVKGAEGVTTTKLQEIAEQRKALEAQSGRVEKLSNLSGEVLETYSRGQAVRSELEQLSKVNLGELWQSDADQARKISDAISQRNAEFNNIVARLNQQEAAMADEQAAQATTLAEQGKAAVLAVVPDFEAQASEVIKYAVEKFGKLGVTKESAENWAMNPVAAIMAHDSMMFNRMKAKASKTTPKPVQATPVKPVAKKGGGNASALPSDKDTPEEWRRKREAQIRRRVTA